MTKANASKICLAIATGLFLLAAFGVQNGNVGFVPLGLCFFALAFLIT